MPYKVSEGPQGICPDCGEATPVRKASLVRDPPSDSWIVPDDILRSIYVGMVRSYRIPKTAGKVKKSMTCSNNQCRKRTSKHYWAEIVTGGLVGPFCKGCLLEDLDSRADKRGWRVDVPIYITPCNVLLMKEAQAALASSTPIKPDLVIRDEDVTLF